MARIEGQKLKILVLADILARETDSAHGLTVPQLIEALAARGIPAERKSIYTDLRALEDFGLDVICLREGHICRWALASRTFEVAELKLLVDAVQSSKFLSEKKSRALIKKLESLCSRHEAKALQRQVFVTNRPKSCTPLSPPTSRCAFKLPSGRRKKPCATAAAASCIPFRRTP